MIHWLMKHQAQGHRSYVVMVDSLMRRVLFVEDHEVVACADPARYEATEVHCEDCGLMRYDGDAEDFAVAAVLGASNAIT